MKAKAKFDAAMVRCEKLIEIYEGSKNYDVLRMVVVLGVSALDSYATNRFMDECIPYVRKCCDEDSAAKFLEKLGLTFKVAIKIFKSGGSRPLRKVRTEVERIHEKDVRQSFKKIDDLFVMYGVSDISKHALKKIGCKTAEKKIGNMIKRRHQIVHEAESNKILLSVVLNWLDYLKRFVDAIDDILFNSFSSMRRRFIKMQKQCAADGTAR